jgi:hypothetical protein
MLQELEQSFLKFEDLEYEIIVKNGNPELEIPRLIIEKGIDLLAESQDLE